MKKNKFLVLSITVIMTGAVLISTGCIINKIILNNSSKALEEMNNFTEDMISRNQGIDAVYDYDAISDLDLVNIIRNAQNDHTKYIIGQIIIEDISLNLPILKGTTNSNLSVGAATMKEDQQMGEGNYALAGHYNKNPHVLFGGIMNIKKGSIIFLTDKKFIYEYRVYDTYITNDKATDMLSDAKSIEKGTPIITLMTCYYSSKTGKRYFVVGEYITKYHYNADLLDS
jgi:sortase A